MRGQKTSESNGGPNLGDNGETVSGTKRHRGRKRKRGALGRQWRRSKSKLPNTCSFCLFGCFAQCEHGFWPWACWSELWGCPREGTEYPIKVSEADLRTFHPWEGGVAGSSGAMGCTPAGPEQVLGAAGACC